ncbi:MAG: transglutaminase domain-containing protein [Phycisphaerales bacterium]|nr:MAG: transglutaminase domain-containing protein [Phycisphaerales bacterium]
MHETIGADEEGNTVSKYRLVLEIRRDRQRLTIEQASSFVERPDGTPVSMRSEQSLGAEPVVLEASFKENGIELVTRSGGREVRDTRPPIEGRWLPPAAAAEYVRQRLEAGAEEIVVRTVDPAGGLVPVTITRSNITRTEVEVIGKRIPAFRTSVRHSSLPGIESTEYLDASGRAVRSSINLGPMSLEIIASERELALAELDPPELMQRTFVRPDRLIERPRGATSASFVLSVPEGALPELPVSGAQTVEPLEDGRVRVHVRAGRTTPAPDAADPVYLQASTMLDLTDPELIALHRRATRNLGDDPKARAEALRRFVYRYITDKSLGVGFATASEVARTRHGDCTEHSALLAALLRLDGVPSRVVSGLIYADSFAGSDDIFGFHMWVQAAVEIDGERRWLDLDPALPERSIFDATHIALATSTLRDDEPTNSMVALVPLMGRLEIVVERVEHDARGR